MVTGSFSMSCSFSRSLQELARLKRDEGIQHLSSCFQWRDFEEDDQRQLIQQEFVYENVMYSVKRGLPWTAVAQMANLSKELLPELRGLEKSEAISLIGARLAQCEPRLPPAHHSTLYDFMVESYVHHHHLYQAFLNGEANISSMHSSVEIDVPPYPLALCEGTDVAVWQKQKALKELKEAEAVKHAEICRLREQVKTRLMAKLQHELSNLSLVEDRLNRQAAESMIRPILQAQGDMLKEILLVEITAVQELLELRLNQTSLQGAEVFSTASGSTKNIPTESAKKSKKK